MTRWGSFPNRLVHCRLLFFREGFRSATGNLLNTSDALSCHTPYLSLCLPLPPSLIPYVCLSLCLSVSAYICPCVCFALYISISFSLALPLSISQYFSMCPLSLPVCRSLSIYFPLSLSLPCSATFRGADIIDELMRSSLDLHG